jgi:hypothetical protein
MDQDKQNDTRFKIEFAKIAIGIAAILVLVFIFIMLLKNGYWQEEKNNQFEKNDKILQLENRVQQNEIDSIKTVLKK